MNTKNKLFILGDSFCTHICHINGIGHIWVDKIKPHFSDNYEIVVSAYSSRDVQTIIDNWIKLLPTLTKDDIIIICIPFYTRIRVPLNKDDYMITEWSGGEIVNRFVTHHSWYLTDSQHLYINDEKILKSDLDERINFFETLYYENESVEKNYNEVIESLYKLTPSKKYIFSWDDMKYQTNIIEYKKQLTEKIGWTTRDELYKETNGHFGLIGDSHWDYRTQENFAKYIIEKFK